jgi:hypothetical protein
MLLTLAPPSAVAIVSELKREIMVSAVPSQLPKTATTAIQQQMTGALPRARLSPDTNAREAPPLVQMPALSSAVMGRGEAVRLVMTVTRWMATAATLVVLSKLTTNVSVVTTRLLIAAEPFVETEN